MANNFDESYHRQRMEEEMHRRHGQDRYRSLAMAQQAPVPGGFLDQITQGPKISNEPKANKLLLLLEI